MSEERPSVARKQTLATRHVVNNLRKDFGDGILVDGLDLTNPEVFEADAKIALSVTNLKGPTIHGADWEYIFGLFRAEKNLPEYSSEESGFPEGVPADCHPIFRVDDDTDEDTEEIVGWLTRDLKHFYDVDALTGAGA